MHFPLKSASVALCAFLLAGCAAYFPSIGPTRHGIEHQDAKESIPPIPVIDVNEEVTRRLVAQRTRLLFSEVLTARPDQLLPMGKGDFLTVTIWEAAPATLFGSVQLDPRGIPAPALATTLPEQPVDGEGCITVPFAGRVPAAGKTLSRRICPPRSRWSARSPPAHAFP